MDYQVQLFYGHFKKQFDSNVETRLTIGTYTKKSLVV